jgi:UV DNA damage endonuclease
MRISMHPDQFVLINALDPAIVASSVAELQYHCDVLDGMELPESAKVQIHVGGVYGDKREAIGRFAAQYEKLPAQIRRRLVIENDDRLFSADDCLKVHELTGVPILFDTFHHECLPGERSLEEAFAACARTWRQRDGVIMVDYSSQQKGERRGKHSEHINLRHFTATMARLGSDCDVMLEIRDKEASATKAVQAWREAERQIH